MSRLARTLLPCLVLALAGCAPAFQTTELFRPLAVDVDLDRPSQIDAVERAMSSRRAIPRRDWHPATNLAMELVGVYRYDKWRSMIVNLAESLNAVPENPYGWVYLGIYLALQRQPEAAIEATEAGLKAMPSPGTDAVWQRLRAQLQTVALLNIALYNLTLQRYESALVTLRRIEPPEQLDAFRRLAYYWIAAQAYSALKRPHDARAALAAAEGIGEAALEQSIPRQVIDEYPQYFSADGRTASTRYLRGVLALDEGDVPAALRHLESALDRDPEMWEAHFARVHALRAARRDREVRDRLLELVRVLPETGFYAREVLHFSLGNVYLARGEHALAAEAYRQAMIDADRRSGSYLSDPVWRDLERSSPAGAIIARTLDPNRRGFPHAENNFADAQLELILVGRLTGEARLAALDDAEKALERAIANPTYRQKFMAHANLARVHAERGRWEDFLRQAALAIRDNRAYLGTLRILFLSTETPDLERASQAYTLIFDTLSLLRGDIEAETTFREATRLARRRLEAGPSGLEQARALNRLYAYTGEWSSALTHLQDSMQRYPDAVFTAVGEAKLRFAEGDLPAAERALERALTLEAGNSLPGPEADRRDALFLSAALKLQRRDPAAIRDVDRAQAISPGSLPGPLRSPVQNVIRNLR